MRDLHTPRALIYWADLLISAAGGWAAFAYACIAPPRAAAVGGLVAILLLYRAVCFTHELTHLRPKLLPGFETAWNLVAGIPMLMPSFTYVGVHQDHHNVATYGTAQDPEYMPFARSHLMTATFLVQSLLMPLLLLLRFVVLAPVGLLWPRLHRWLAERASSFAMNAGYRRRVDAQLLERMARWELAILLLWGVIFSLLASGFLPWRVLLMWAGAVALISFVNTLRALGAHRYESSGEPLDRGGQLLDSVDVPGGPWTTLWAPVGLRYHALHHYFPGIPYHNLGRAYVRLCCDLPAGTLYHDTTATSLFASLRRLLATGYRTWSRRQEIKRTESVPTP